MRRNAATGAREQGLFPADLQQWRQSAMAALSQPEEARASPQETRDDRRRIKELERDFRRKEKALAETAALLVLSTNVWSAPFAQVFSSDRTQAVLRKCIRPINGVSPLLALMESARIAPHKLGGYAEPFF
jgi:hypothetical protein